MLHGNGEIFAAVVGEGASKRKAILGVHLQLLEVQYKVIGVNLDGLGGVGGLAVDPMAFEAFVDERVRCVSRAAVLPTEEARARVLRDSIGLA